VRAKTVRAKTAECAGCGGRSQHQDIVEVLASLGSGLYAGCPDGRLQVRGCVVSRNMITTVIVVVVIISRGGDNRASYCATAVPSLRPQAGAFGVRPSRVRLERIHNQ
jgi:hypothetical protein